ncbi:MAG: CGP-CTERM sorting domain-containing protein, partial [Rhodobacterales bacterium]|nr:CGP-CTERM sorting domain-containing protein [Rhodobacterales bacterium]
ANHDDEANDPPPVTPAGTTTTTTSEIEPPDTQTTPGGADIEIVDIEGSNGIDRCGCSTSSGPAALWVLSLFPLLLRRRRN